MFLQKSLEKKLNNTIKEYGLILEDKNQNKIASHSPKFKLDPKKFYPKEVRLFSNDDISDKAKEAKEYLKQVKDPDILELNKKPWNATTRSGVSYRPELKKTLFEVRHGLKDVNMVKLKPKKIELGCDGRNVSYFGWNSSSLIENSEKKYFDLEKKEQAVVNSISFWKKIEMNGSLEYKSPYEQNKDSDTILRDFKKKKFEDRERVKSKLQYENPKASPEKIAALAYKEMYPKIIFDLKAEQKKNTDYYHDSEEMVRLLNLPNHHNVVEKRAHQRIENIEAEKIRRHEKVVNKIYFKKHKELFDQKESEFVKKNEGYFHSTHNNTNHTYDDKSLTSSHRFTSSPLKIKTCADSYCHKLTVSSASNKYLNDIFNHNQKRNSLSYKKDKPWLLKEFHHPGKWTKIPSQLTEKIEDLAEDKKHESWSCCFSYDKFSKVR